MKHNKNLGIVTVVAALVWATGAWCQEEPMWQVENKAPARIVPLYQGAPNPFPQAVEATNNAPDPALMERERIRQEAINKASQILQSVGGLEADVSRVSFQGAILSPTGSRVLYGNRWLKEGDKMPVGVKASAATYASLSEVKSLDEKSASQLEDTLKYRVQTAGQMWATVQKITSSSVVVGTEKRSYTIPLPPGGDL